MKFHCARPAQLFSHNFTKSTFLRTQASQNESHLDNKNAKKLRQQRPAATRHRTSSYLRQRLLAPVVAAIILATIRDAQGGIDAQNTLSCHRRQYRYKITETDANGRACWDYVNVMSCWGRCESHEIADWKFPYKRSHHPVCQHAGVRESQVVLRNCDADVAPGTEIHKFTEAAVCACSLCRSSETSCEGLRFRGVRRAPRDAGLPGARGSGAGPGKAGDSEVTGIAKREHQSRRAGTGADEALGRSPRQTTALMVTKPESKPGYGGLLGDKPAQKFKGRLPNMADAGHGKLKRSFDGSVASVTALRLPSAVLVKKDLENFVEIPADRELAAPYPEYADDEDDEEEFFYVDSGTRDVPIGATGRGVLSSGGAVQRPKQDDEFPLKSFEEAAAAAKLLMLRKQLNERGDERRPSLREAARMIANYRKLEQLAGPPATGGGGDFLLSDFVGSRVVQDDRWQR